MSETRAQKATVSFVIPATLVLVEPDQQSIGIKVLYWNRLNERCQPWRVFTSLAAASTELGAWGAMDIPLPLSKLAMHLVNHDDKDKKYVVLVATGSFNPPTYMHLRMLELARDALNSEGFCVIGGYISPVNNAYNKRGLISAEHRIQLCHLACKSSEFIMVDPWEARQSTFQRTLSVLSRVKGFFSASGLIPSESLKCMLICGSDLLHFLAFLEFGFPTRSGAYVEIMVWFAFAGRDKMLTR
ncbi:hypothetical protein ACLB2K_028354 [Fragaria x ananassa]